MDIQLKLGPGTTRRVRPPGHDITYEFHGGQITPVPNDVGEWLVSKTENGERIFLRADGAQSATGKPQDHDDSDIVEALGVQLTWHAWASVRL